MDIQTKKTVLIEYRNRNLAIFDDTMDEECLPHVVLASGMLEGLAAAEEADYFEAWSYASSLLKDTMFDETSTELDIEYAVGRVSGVIFFDTDDHRESIKAGRQEVMAIHDVDGIGVNINTGFTNAGFENPMLKTGWTKPANPAHCFR